MLNREVGIETSTITVLHDHGPGGLTAPAAIVRAASARKPASSTVHGGGLPGSIQSFWEANMALLEDSPDLDLNDRDWLIHTRSEERAPAKVGATSQVHRSLISHGCVINGTVVNSVLSPGVRVEVGAVVRDSIVMFDSVIRSGAVVDRLKIPGFLVGDEIAAGVPVLRAVGAEAGEMLLALKSGNFGGPAFFSDALSLMR